MKTAYINCMKRLRNFRKGLKADSDLKRGKLYFEWIKQKTDNIEHEQDEQFVYKNLVKYTLVNYRIDKYTYERLETKLKNIVNKYYVLKNNNYVFNDKNINIIDAMLIAKEILFKRGNVVWIDFGFNIGNEFGGMHPAIIVKNFNKELLVLPVSSKKPKEYIKIEREYENGKITLQECENRKKQITEVVQIDSIYRFKSMTRWINITRIKKVSILRMDFNGTIGKIDGKYMSNICKNITLEFYE